MDYGTSSHILDLVFHENAFLNQFKGSQNNIEILYFTKYPIQIN
jgi:hypothetical protein